MDEEKKDTTTTGETGGSPPAADTPKTFTQEDVNGLVAKESKSAVEKLLKEAGIAPEGDYKQSMAAFKTWQDSQKTALELKDSEVATLQADKELAETKANALERQLAAVSSGIPSDRAAKYIKLAEAYVDDATDFNAAIVLALKDFPLTKDVPGTGGNPPPGDNPPKKALPKGTVTF